MKSGTDTKGQEETHTHPCFLREEKPLSPSSEQESESLSLWSRGMGWQHETSHSVPVHGHNTPKDFSLQKQTYRFTASVTNKHSSASLPGREDKISQFTAQDEKPQEHQCTCATSPLPAPRDNDSRSSPAWHLPREISVPYRSQKLQDPLLPEHLQPFPGLLQHKATFSVTTKVSLPTPSSASPPHQSVVTKLTNLQLLR